MTNHLTYEGIKYNKGSVSKVTDPLVIEQALQININEKPFTVVMQTPGDENEIVRGLLYAEDVIKANTPIEISFEKNQRGLIEKAKVIIPEDQLGKGYLSTRSLLSVSSCGICGKQELSDIKPDEQALQHPFKIKPETIFRLQKTMFNEQDLFQLTGGCHGVAAFDSNGKMLCLFEDIGRHNALDKVVGHLLLNDQLSKAKIISFSGRISYEIVSKSFRAKIPVIVAVSAPSSLAVDFAKEFGLTLLAFSRENKTTCYANQWRIIDEAR